jgi:hypothetical protein
MEDNPRKVFYQLFGQGDTPAERQAILEETGSILDYVAAKARGCSGASARRPRARQRLPGFGPRVEQRVQKLASEDSAKMELPNAPQGVPDDFGQHLELLFDMMALAWQANMTRVPPS